MTKPITPFRNFAKAPKKVRNKPKLLLLNKKNKNEPQNGNGNPDPAVVYFFCSATAQIESTAPYCWGAQIRHNQTHTHTHPAGLP